MIEIKQYSKQEIAEILGTIDTQGINRKLQRYNVDFETTGWGNHCIYTIKAINEPFKVFSITEMGISANADFRKLKYIFLYLLNDDEFATLPMVEMQNILNSKGIYISRQTISKWIDYLNSIDYIHRDRYDFHYYAVSKTENNQKQYRVITKEEYCTAWKIYWEQKEIDQLEGNETTETAYADMYQYLDGHPCKVPVIIMNAIYLKKINQMIEIINDEFLNTSTLQ